MSETARTGGRLPEPGHEGAADATTEGVQQPAEEESEPEGRRVVTRLERSGSGPGAGEEDIVRVETPVQHEGDEEVTHHPTLRGDSQRLAEEPETE
jgi:hypothetical protein